MKRLILICGANGIGKSTACKEVVNSLEKSAYIDSDWCRVINSFEFTEEMINVVKANISARMINYFQCNAIENIIFSYGFYGPRKQIFDDILVELDKHKILYEFCPIILQCELDENIKRMKKDGRDAARIERAINNTRTIYDNYDYPKIDTTKLSINETAKRIINVISTLY